MPMRQVNCEVREFSGNSYADVVRQIADWLDSLGIIPVFPNVITFSTDDEEDVHNPANEHYIATLLSYF